MLSNRAKTTACCIPASVAKTDWKDTFSRLSILLTMLAVFLLTGLKTFSQTAVMLEVNGKPYKAGKAVLFGQPAVNLDQAGNGPYTAVQDPMQWQNGNLNPNQAHYIEHHSIPYRLIMTDMPVGTEVTLTMNFDFVNSKKYALDFLTGYQQLQPHSYINHNTEETVNPLAPAAFSAPTSQMDIPAPSYLNAAALNDFNTLTDVDARKISIWGANFNTGASIVYTPEPNILVLDNVNKKVAWTIKFTPTSSTVTLAWGGHIASRDDWGYNATTGEPNSAGGINGSPYHMRTESWSLGNIGNQDRSLQTALAAPTCPTSLIPSGSSNITYNEGSGHYEICPNLPATFSVGTQPAGTTYQWSVTGDATAQGPTDQPNFTVLSAKHCGSFTVTVQIQNGSGFIAICSVTVYVVDTVKPTIALNGVDQGVDGSKTDFKECDEGFPTLSGLTYSDNCNADIAGTGGVVVSDWVIDNTHTTIDGKCVTQKATKKWTVTDYCGNVNTFTYIVYSVDTKAPFISGLSSSDQVQCNTEPQFVTPQVGDNCDPNPTLTHEDSQVDMGNCVTKFIRTWNAVDWCGNKAEPVSQYFLIRHDNTPPTVDIKATKDLGCNPGSITFDEPSVSDDCGTPTAVDGYPQTGTESIDGCKHSLTKTWKYVDACGNVGTATQTLSWIVDTEAPNVTNGNSFTKDLGCNPPGDINSNFITPTFDGGCSEASVVGPTLVSEVTTGCNQSRTWKWVANDCSGKSTTVTQTLNWIVDHDAPIVTGNGSFEKALGCNPTNVNDNFKTPTFDGGCSAANVSGPVETNTVDGCAHSRTWTWTATDCSGLSTTVTQKLTWTEDHDAPAVTSNNSFEKALGCNPTNINDNFKTPTFDGGCSAANVSGPVETNTVVGCAHTRSWSWTATDCSGLSTTVTQTLTWTEDHDAPSVTSNNSFEKAIGCNPTNINDNFKTPTFDGGCSAANVSGPVETNTVDGCAHSRSWTWTATDCSGLSTTVTQKLTWTEDHDAPAVTSNDSFEKDLGCNPSNINDNFKTPTFDGGCSVANVSGPVESNSVKDCTHSRSWTWTATDCSGIPTTVTQTLSWKEDLVKPVFDNVPADASYDCGTTIPDAPVVTATDNCDGTLTATLVSQTDLIEGDCGVYYFYRNWSVKDACGNTNTAQQKITINPVNPIFVPESLPGDETIECGAGVPPTNPPTATVCTPAGPVEATITGPERSDNVKIDDCSYQYTETWTAIYPGTANCQNPPSAQYTRTVTVVDTQKPTISGLPTETTVTVKCDQDLPPVPEVTATDACDPNPKVVYEQTGPVAMNCVDGIKESYTRTWYAVDACGNKTETFTQTINVMCCEAFCTYTQGYYGNPGGTSCDGTGNTYTTAQLITKSLNTWGGITLGKAGVRSIKVGTGDASYVIDYLPGGGASKKLNPGDCNISDATCIKSYLKNGRFSNTLLAQTLTLMLNVGVKTSLGDLELKSGMYLNTGDLEGGCGSKIIKSCQYDIYGNVTYSPYHSYMLPASVINYLSGIGKANVSGLIELANNLLGGDAAPSGVTLDAVASAEDILNNAFDECKGFAGWSAQPKTCPPPPPSDGVAPSSPMITTQQLSVKAFPNPYNEDITFVINSSVSGRGTLNLFNLKGEQVSTVFDGNVQANKTITLTYKVPPLHRTSLVYHFAIGKKIETGKLIRPN